MLFLILLSAAFFQGITSGSLEEIESNLCEKDPFEACRFKKNGTFPESAEDVDALCKDLVPFHHCISEFLRNCDTDEGDDIPHRGFFNFGAILILCNNQSRVYQGNVPPRYYMHYLMNFQVFV
nr:uncharacterized protein LOC107454636 [Parasteatoda tepidariorum]